MSSTQTVHILDHVDSSVIEGFLERDEFFWLDLMDPSPEDIRGLEQLFPLHPLTVEDISRRGQRPKLERFDEYLFLVYYGARAGIAESIDWVEMHIFISGSYVVTVHQSASAELDVVKKQLRAGDVQSELFIIYRIIDALTDSFFPLLERVNDRIDRLDIEILAAPKDQHLEEIRALRHDLIKLRRIVEPQRDLLGRSIDEIISLPGLEGDSRNYFRDVHDHLIRIADLIDAYREVLAGSRETYLSMVSNRLNQVTKQLTIIATIFLPLSFITGFFGQNFKWMTDHIQGLEIFMLLGPGVIVATLIGLLFIFRRGGYL